MTYGIKQIVWNQIQFIKSIIIDEHLRGYFFLSDQNNNLAWNDFVSYATPEATWFFQPFIMLRCIHAKRNINSF